MSESIRGCQTVRAMVEGTKIGVVDETEYIESGLFRLGLGLGPWPLGGLQQA